MRFICLGYADEKLWEVIYKGDQDAMIEEFFAYDDVLRSGGHPCLRVGDVLEIRPADEEFNARIAAREALVVRH
jgi:hypothetical protein